MAFGNDTVKFNVNSANVLEILSPKSVTSSRSPQQLISEVLNFPIAIKRLEKLFQKPQKTVIIIPDKTRNCGANIILPILINYLNGLGVRDSDIKVILAMGSHAPHTPHAIEKIVGNAIIKRIEIIEHNCHNLRDLVYLGKTKFGTPIYINQHVVNAERLIILGTAVHHYFAGYGGGPKMINPGCAGYETITKNHALTIDAETGTIHPGCQAGVLKGNPVQEDIKDSLRFIDADFLIETIFNADGEIVEAVGGDLIAAHHKACSTVDALYKVDIHEKADLVVVSCGGYPKDINLIQAHKSLNNAFYSVKEGGVILILAECRDGIGSQTFLDWFQYADEAAFHHDLKLHYKLNGTTALSLKMKTRAVKIIFISKLPGELVTHLGMVPASSFAEGWKLACSHLPERFKCYVIPNGSLTLPTLNAYVD
ncbi:MAG: nickel-dependent lactate racemase [bacterium]